MSGVKLADTVRLNVGGTSFMTTKATLCKYPASMLAAMFRGDVPAVVDETGAYFIDRDGSLFGYILNFLRSSRLMVPEGFAGLEQLSVEAEFFQIEPLTDEVNSLLKKKTTASTQHEKGGCTLEIMEICRGIAGERTGMATSQNVPRIYFEVITRIYGRRRVIMSLPPDICSVPGSLYGGGYMHDYGGGYMHDLDSFIEIEQLGSDVRLRLAEYLHGEGWQLARSDQSTCTSYKKLDDYTILERCFREGWFRSGH